MNKSELIEALSNHYDGNKVAAKKALDSVLDTITREMVKGEKVAITGFGAFEKVVRESRMVRNPRTNERKRAKKKAVPKFRAGANLKDMVSGEKKLPKVTTAAAAGNSTASRSTASTSKRAGAAKTSAKKATSKAASSTRSTGAKSTPKRAPAAKSTAAKRPAAAKSAAKKSAAKSTTAKSTGTKSASTKSTAAKRSGSTGRATSKSTAKKR